MQLAIHSDVPYLSVSQARIQDSGVNFLSKGPPDLNNPEYLVLTTNGILLVVWKIMRNIMAPAAEAEYHANRHHMTIEIGIWKQNNMTKDQPIWRILQNLL